MCLHHSLLLNMFSVFRDSFHIRKVLFKRWHIWTMDCAASYHFTTGIFPNVCVWLSFLFYSNQILIPCRSYSPNSSFSLFLWCQTILSFTSMPSVIGWTHHCPTPCFSYISFSFCWILETIVQSNGNKSCWLETQIATYFDC